MRKDCYSLLGIDKDASVAEIKQAYKKLSIKLHPDKNKGDPDKELKFIEMKEAYEVLSDSVKRAEYDKSDAAGEVENPHNELRQRIFQDVLNQFLEEA